MITDSIGRHDVLLPINQNYDKPLIERWMILKCRYMYECWKTQQFTQKSAPQQQRKMTCTRLANYKHDAYTVHCSNRAADSHHVKFENFVIVLINLK